jgi:hypothetical protein
MMFKDLKSELKQQLDPNETLLWTGQPQRGIVFRPSDIFIIPFSLFWCGFAIFWFVSALTSGAPIFFAMFGIPFVIIGLIFVFGRFIIDAKQREHTTYGLTENRIIIKSGVFSKSVKSLNIKTLFDIEFIEKEDGSGTITFGPKNPMTNWASGMNWWPGMAAPATIELIPHVREVYNQIIALQNKKG